MSSSQPGYALITGASAGIGAAIAREYAARGKPLVLTARRSDRLEALAATLRAQVPCEIIVADLADPAAPDALFAATQQRGLFVDTLVNNAGYGVPGAYPSSPWTTHAAFLQVMIHAVSELTWRYLPPMQAAAHGRILNVASMAGLVPGSAGHTLYGASKSFLIKFSESLALENREHGVHVTALCPGFTYSEFHDVTGTRAQVSRMPDWMWLSAEEVARQGVEAVERGEVLMIPGHINRWLRQVAKHLPDRWARALVAARSSDFRDTH
jgi:short-subunit dehydrogenase